MNDDIKRISKFLETINKNINHMNKNINDMNINTNNTNTCTNNMNDNINNINMKINNIGCDYDNQDIKKILEDIHVQFNKIEIFLENTNLRLEKVESTLNIVNKSTKNMDEHINFVENVYTVVKKPFVSLLGFYYNKNLVKTLQMPNVSPRQSTLDNFDVKKRIVLHETSEYEIVETSSETEK